MLFPGSKTFHQNPRKGYTKRRQECRRGTQECVRHNGFNTLLKVSKN